MSNLCIIKSDIEEYPFLRRINMDYAIIPSKPLSDEEIIKKK